MGRVTRNREPVATARKPTGEARVWAFLRHRVADAMRDAEVWAGPHQNVSSRVCCIDGVRRKSARTPWLQASMPTLELLCSGPPTRMVNTNVPLAPLLINEHTRWWLLM